MKKARLCRRENDPEFTHEIREFAPAVGWVIESRATGKLFFVSAVKTALDDLGVKYLCNLRPATPEEGAAYRQPYAGMPEAFAAALQEM